MERSFVSTLLVTLTFSHLPSSSSLLLSPSCGQVRTCPHACRAGPLRLQAEPDTPEDGLTEVGSKAYYDGFLSTPLEESRGDGTEQAIKLAASTVGVVAVLLLGFMASNGLL